MENTFAHTNHSWNTSFGRVIARWRPPIQILPKWTGGPFGRMVNSWVCKMYGAACAWVHLPDLPQDSGENMQNWPSWMGTSIWYVFWFNYQLPGTWSKLIGARPKLYHLSRWRYGVDCWVLGIYCRGAGFESQFDLFFLFAFFILSNVILLNIKTFSY